MSMQGIKTETQLEKAMCPYCYAKLGIREIIARQMKKTYQCPKCHKRIDERFVVR